MKQSQSLSATLLFLLCISTLWAQHDSLGPALPRHTMYHSGFDSEASVLERTERIAAQLRWNLSRYGKVLPEPALEPDSATQAQMIRDIVAFEFVLGSWQGAIKNPYLGRYFKAEPNLGGLVQFEFVSKSKNIGPLDPGSSAKNAVGFADGLAKFLVNRTKTELNAAFLESLSKECQKNIYLEHLFPNTRQLLGLMQERIYHFNPFLMEIRDASQADLQEIPDNLATFLESDIPLPIPKRERIWLTDALFVRSMIYNNKLETPEVFSRLSDRLNTQNITPAQKGIAAGLGMLVIGADCFHDYADHTWPESADSLYRDVFLGILFDDYKNSGVGDQRLGSIMPNVADDTLFQLFSRYRDVYMDLDKRLEKKNRSATAAAEMRVKMLADGRHVDETPETYPYLLPVVESLNRTMQFAEVFMRVLTPADTALHRKLRISAQASDFFTRLSWKAAEKKWGEVLLYTGSLVALMAGDNEVSCKFLRYGSFLSSLPACNSSDEVAALIETFALPPGSSRIKKESPFSVGIGSYVGGFGGWEFLRNVNAQDRAATTLSLSAPVGLALSKGYHGWAFTGFATLIDVGAFTAFRFDNANYTAELPAMTLANIFAPGAALVVGVPKYPFAFGLNAQVGPNIRGISENGIYQFNETGAWRFGATVTVDIPLLNLYAPGGGERCY